MITRQSSLRPRGVLSLFLSLLFAALVGMDTVRAEEAPDPKAAALQASEAWLTLVDKAQYGESWDKASKFFKDAVTSQQWEAALKQARSPLGELRERRHISSLLQTEIPAPGGPLKGRFVILQYDSSYEHLGAARELVTFSEEADGKWRAIGYFVQPR